MSEAPERPRNLDEEDEPECIRTADVSLEASDCFGGISPAFLQDSPDELMLSSKELRATNLLQNYEALFPGPPRLRKICDDQEIYEVEVADVNLHRMQPVPLQMDKDTVNVEPTIKFAEDYHNETSSAAANLALQMQEDDESLEGAFDSCFKSMSDLATLKSLVEDVDGAVTSSESRSGSMSPAEETASPKLPVLQKMKNNLDFPWTPLFEMKEDSSSPELVQPSAFTSVSRVKFMDEGSGFVLPAAPGHTPFHVHRESRTKSPPYRVTPHPSTGRTVMPAALGSDDTRSPVGDCFIPSGESPALSGQPGTSSKHATDAWPVLQQTPADSPTLLVPHNTPMDESEISPNVLPSRKLQELLRESVARMEDEDMDSSMNRQHHNHKERIRRNRIKGACERLRSLVPGLSEKTDKATVFEFAVHYIAYLRSLLDENCTPVYDRDFLKKARRMMLEEPIRLYEIPEACQPE